MGKNNENSEKNKESSVNKKPINNISDNVKNSIDLNSIMELANNLMKNENLLNSIVELRKMRENTALPVSDVSKKQEKLVQASSSDQLEDKSQENADLASLNEKLENISNQFSELKKDLIEVKESVEKLFKKSKKKID